MPWTKITRPNYVREGLRYTIDQTDAEWKLIKPLLPAPSRIGRPRTTDLRSVVDALLYIVTTGCQWRQLPKEFPPYSTVQGYFYAWSRNGTFVANGVAPPGATLSSDLTFPTRNFTASFR